MKFFLAYGGAIALLFSISACKISDTAMNNSHSIKADDPRIRVMGRSHVASDGSRLIGYPGVTLALNAQGAQLSVELASSSGNSWVDISVDGGAARAVKLDSTTSNLELFNFPQSGQHRVEIVHRSENWHGQVAVKQFHLRGETFLTPPPLPQRKLLVLGDSVTCGEAIDRAPGENKNTRWWNARESYGMLTAAALNAQVHLVCWGGRGLIRSWNNNSDEAQLPVFYQYALGDSNPAMTWDHRDYQPDLIISAIGTNDFSPGIPERNTYVNAYVAFIQQLRANHPQAQIVLTEGAILQGEKKAALTSYIAASLQVLGDKQVHYLASNHYPGDAQDAHPTREQHAAMAADLIPALQALMHW